MRYRGPTFMIDVPPQWAQARSSTHMAVFVGASDHEVPVAVTLDRLPMGIERAASVAIDDQQHRLTGFRLLRERAGRSALYRRYRWDHPVAGPVLQHQMFVSSGRGGWLLTATRPDQPGLARHDATFQEMYRSLRFAPDET